MRKRKILFCICTIFLSVTALLCIILRERLHFSNDSAGEKISYQDIIERARMLIQCKTDDIYLCEDVEVGLDTNNEKLGYVKYGYYIEDIDGDGTEELFIGTNATRLSKECGGSIYKIYTRKAGRIIQIDDVSSHSVYYLCSDGLILNKKEIDGSTTENTFYSLINKDLCPIESVVVKHDYSDGNSVSYNYLNYDSIIGSQDYVIIDESKAQSVLSNHKILVPQFEPIVNTIDMLNEQQYEDVGNSVEIVNNGEQVICECDIDRNKEKDWIVFDYSAFSKDRATPIILSIYGNKGDIYYSEVIGIHQSDCCQYYLIVVDDIPYLVKYVSPREAQGSLYCSCEIYTFDVKGEKVIYDSLFEDNKNNINDFLSKSEMYIEKSVFLISTLNSQLKCYGD